MYTIYSNKSEYELQFENNVKVVYILIQSQIVIYNKFIDFYNNYFISHKMISYLKIFT